MQVLFLLTQFSDHARTLTSKKDKDEFSTKNTILFDASLKEYLKVNLLWLLLELFH